MPSKNHRTYQMTKTEPVDDQMPTGQRDISALERHQRQLLYGGGVFLSVIILLIAVASILLSIDDYKSGQLDSFRKAKLALDSAFVQRDAGYIRTLNMIEYAWKNRANELVAEGDQDFQDFASHDSEALIQADKQSVPWLVLGRGVEAWPREKVDRYLGLIRDISVISGTSLTMRSDQSGGRPSTTANFYDPSQALFAFGMDANAPEAGAALKKGGRADLFNNWVVPTIDFGNLETLKALRQGNPRLSFYGQGLPKIPTSLGNNPLNGEPSIRGALVAMDGDVPLGVFVVYEPIQPFIDQIRKMSTLEMTVVSGTGQMIFGTGSEAHDEAVAAAIKPFLTLKSFESDVVKYRRGGMFFIAERIEGTPWTLVRAYDWSDILQGELVPILTAITLAILLLGALWLLLIRQDRSVFAPVLARAKRVYQSEVLNRTMIETSPVGLCVISTSDAVPILQNDLVRDYAVDIPDHDNTFYKQLLHEFSSAENPLSGRPEAREFSVTLANEQGGSTCHLLVAAMPIVYQDREALFCVLRDMTARVELEENLRRARQDSEQAKLAAESASRAKTSFVATMSHEIRTPLNGILGHLELLGRSHLEPAQRERLERIRLSADVLLAIISDVLDFSRIEAGQLDIDPLPFELRALIEQTALLYAPAAQRKGLRLYYGVEPGLASTYVADAYRIRQVLNNLVSNAVKFTESGRIILRVRAVPQESKEQVRLRFEVIDSGIGMSEQQRKQVFQPFSQADASISRRFGGSGLGLTLCRQLTELMGGEIEVQSTPLVGSVFSFELPAVVDELAAEQDPTLLANRRIALLSAATEWRTEVSSLLEGWGAEVMTVALPSELDPSWLARADALIIFGSWYVWSEDEERALVAGAKRAIKATTDGPLLPELRDGVRFVSCYSSDALLEAILEADAELDLQNPTLVQDDTEPCSIEPRRSVLLVDDNPVNRELIQQQLEILGYAVDVAEDGVVALRLWQEGRYDIVLTDINMPHMNGYELTEKLRARGVQVPILAVTATALTSEKMRCKQAGIDDLLLKPLSLEQLGEAMSRHLAHESSSAAPLVKTTWARKYPEKISRIFIESGTRDLDAILDAAGRGDGDALLARIHSLKGALLMLGEQDVARHCAGLEKRIDAEGVDLARSGVKRLESSMRELLQRYAQSA
jgi:two-component system, NarL family, capsular synthesis sensor histidine kinase RcsC